MIFKNSAFLLSGILCFFFNCSFSPLMGKSKDNRILVAVMPFNYKAEDLKYTGVEAGLAQAVASELLKKKVFRIIERERVDVLLKEMKYQQTGLVDSNTALELGKHLGAQAYLLGSVISVSVRDEWRSVKFAEKTVRFVEVEAEVKIVDIQTGEVLASGRSLGKSKTAEKHAFGGKVGELATVQSMTQKAVQNLSKKLCKDLIQSYRSE